MAIHAATSCGASVVGITLSEAQASYARHRVAASGLSDRVEIRVQDYRDLRGERFDAISSVGMFEHVGKVRTAQYFETLHGLLAPEGRLLNHAISEVGGTRLGSRSFFGRYVFPDGELLDVGDVVLAMERSGFECRDVESLREHYARTLRAWVANLEANWDAAVAEVGLSASVDLAPLHGRVCYRLRERRYSRSPGAGRRARPWPQWDGAHARRLGLSKQSRIAAGSSRVHDLARP